MIGRNIDLNNHHGKIIENAGTGRTKNIKVKFKDKAEQWLSYHSFLVRTKNKKGLVSNEEILCGDSELINTEQDGSDELENEAEVETLVKV